MTAHNEVQWCAVEVERGSTWRLARTDRGLFFLGLPNESSFFRERLEARFRGRDLVLREVDPQAFNGALHALAAALDGREVEVDFPLDLGVNPEHQKALLAASLIGPGETVLLGEFSRRVCLKVSTVMRALQSPLFPILPTHRVVAAGGPKGNGPRFALECELRAKESRARGVS